MGRLLKKKKKKGRAGNRKINLKKYKQQEHFFLNIPLFSVQICDYCGSLSKCGSQF